MSFQTCLIPESELIDFWKLCTKRDAEIAGHVVVIPQCKTICLRLVEDETVETDCWQKVQTNYHWFTGQYNVWHNIWNVLNSSTRSKIIKRLSAENTTVVVEFICWECHDNFNGHYSLSDSDELQIT